MLFRSRFREDLYYRLNVIEIGVPALAERPSDILPLARHFLGEALQLSDDAAAALLAHDWPGNVRELENLLARAAIYLSDSAGEEWQDLQAVFPEFGRMRQTAAEAHGAVTPAHAAGDPSARRSPTREDVFRALEQAGGNRAAASRALGIGRTTLWRLMRD